MQLRPGQNAVIGHELRNDRGLSRLHEYRRMNTRIALDHRQIRRFPLQGAAEKMTQ